MRWTQIPSRASRVYCVRVDSGSLPPLVICVCILASRHPPTDRALVALRQSACRFPPDRSMQSPCCVLPHPLLMRFAFFDSFSGPWRSACRVTNGSTCASAWLLGAMRRAMLVPFGARHVFRDRGFAFALVGSGRLLRGCGGNGELMRWVIFLRAVLGLHFLFFFQIVFF